jgi:hypothetical protein
MISKNIIKCYGCSAEVKNINGPVHKYIGSDAGCWDVFCNVLAKEYTRYNELWQSHGLTVDTYAAQHPGSPGKKEIRSVFIHLTRLYLQLVKGIRGKHANEVMKNIIMYKDQCVGLHPVPDFQGTINIADVAKANDIYEHKMLVEKWAWSVWNAWHPHHGRIILFAEENILNDLYRSKKEAV